MPRKTVHPAELPKMLDQADMSMIEEFQRQAALAKALIERCKRCKIPVDMAEADCEAACEFLDAVEREYKGPQSPQP